MFRFLKLIFTLLVLLAFAVVGYAYLGDLSPKQDDVNAPVSLDGS